LLRGIIERSLGAPASYPVLARRSLQQAVARSMGIRTPRGAIVRSADDLVATLRALGGKAVLKRDCSWGGAGVAIVDGEGSALSAFERLRRAHTLRAAARLRRTHGTRYALSMISRRGPTIELQEFVEGAPCNRAVVCRDGEVLCGVTVRAAETTSATGPASVVHPIENAEIDQATVALARHLACSGLIGFDFVTDPAGRAYFLEVNPRSTPTALQSELIETLGRSFLMQTSSADFSPGTGSLGP
jgi:biotin carboxylase